MAKKFYYHGKSNNNAPAVKEPPRYPAEKISVTIETIGVSAATAGLLAKNNINTAGDLAARSEREMFKVQGFNKRMLFELKDALKSQDMTFKPDTPKPVAAKPQSENATNQPRNDKRDKTPSDSGRSDKGGQRNDRRDDRNGNGARRDNKPQAKPIAEKPEKLTEPLPVERWRKIQKGAKWGFFDGFKTVIPAMYDEVFSFCDGLASVELDEKCGYIDSENNIVIPFDYETAMSFSEGYAAVCKTVKFGYIDKENKVVIPFEYDAATKFEGGEAKVKKDGRWGTIFPDGTVKWIV